MRSILLTTQVLLDFVYFIINLFKKIVKLL